MIDNPRTALVLILHGSPRPAANAPALQLAKRLESDDRFIKVLVAYMECNQPTIAEAIDECASTGATHIIALPWFLHAGRHLVLDVPDMLKEAAQRYPALTITITDPVGTSPRLSKALAFRASEALTNHADAS